MLDKIKNYQNHPIIRQLRDIRVVGLIGFGIIVILVTWSGVGAIEENYSLQKQINDLQQRNQLQQLSNNNLDLQNQYYNTNEYLELQAREILGKAAPGEKLILVPKSVALAQTVNMPVSSNLMNSTSPPKPSYQSNFESWMNFYFHRNRN